MGGRQFEALCRCSPTRGGNSYPARTVEKQVESQWRVKPNVVEVMSRSGMSMVLIDRLTAQVHACAVLTLLCRGSDADCHNARSVPVGSNIAYFVGSDQHCHGIIDLQIDVLCCKSQVLWGSEVQVYRIVQAAITITTQTSSRV